MRFFSRNAANGGAVADAGSARDNDEIAAVERLPVGASIRCRLCWRISIAVFLSILTIEAALLIPSYRNYERDLLLRLEDTGRTALITGLRTNAHRSTRDLLIYGGQLIGPTWLTGATLYGMDGSTIGSFGEVPELTPAAARETGVGKLRLAGGERYEVLWPADETGLPFAVVGRLDSGWVSGELVAFVWRILGLVLVISVFVSGATIFVIGRLILRPMLQLRAKLVAARRDPTNAERYAIERHGNDELGDMIGALNDLVHEVSRTRRDELRASERRFRDFTDAASDWFWEMDENLRFSYFSQRFTDVTGVPKEMLLGKTRQETGIPNVDQDAWRTQLANLAARRAFRNFIHPRTKPDGSVVWLSISGKPVYDDDGRFLGYRGVGADITKLKQTEEALRAAKEEAEATNHTKSKFLATMSHELRTPLNAIIGFSEIIKLKASKQDGASKFGEYATDIFDSGQHLLDLINDILDLSKIESGTDELEEQDLEIADIVGPVLTLVKERASRGNVALRTEYPDDLPALNADCRKLKQILANLLSNGIKFTPAGGSVTLRIRCRADGGYVFQIVDTGIGIALEDIPKALTPFEQIGGYLDRQNEGTGLGLALAKVLVELHGGSLDLQSEVGVGTTVTVRLPAERIVSRTPPTAFLPAARAGLPAKLGGD